eukprot:3363648-Pyramimonas_sp.AAC.1
MTSASLVDVDPGGKVGPTPARPTQFGPPLRPIAARPIRRPGTTQAQTRTGAPSQICLLCAELSIE